MRKDLVEQKDYAPPASMQFRVEEQYGKTYLFLNDDKFVRSDPFKFELEIRKSLIDYFIYINDLVRDTQNILRRAEYDHIVVNSLLLRQNTVGVAVSKQIYDAMMSRRISAQPRIRVTRKYNI